MDEYVYCSPRYDLIFPTMSLQYSYHFGKCYKEEDRNKDVICNLEHEGILILGQDFFDIWDPTDNPFHDTSNDFSIFITYSCMLKYVAWIEREFRNSLC